MSKKQIMVLAVSAVFLIAGIVTAVALCGSGKKPKDETVATKTETPVSGSAVKPIRGFDDTEVLEDHPERINQAVLSEIELYIKGTPRIDEDGNYRVDGYGEILRDHDCMEDYQNVSRNLQNLVNRFYSKGYSDEAIQQVQRLYFHYCDSFETYSYEELVNGLGKCIPKDGTAPEALTETAERVFGIVRDDGFPFVFEDESFVCEVIPMADVKFDSTPVLSPNLEKLCLYAELSNPEDDGYERNLEAWLHKIVFELDAVGYGEKEMIVAQILFYGTLMNADYRSDVIDAIRACIPQEREIDFSGLKANVSDTFGLDVSKNSLLVGYMNGTVSFREEK